MPIARVSPFITMSMIETGATAEELRARLSKAGEAAVRLGAVMSGRAVSWRTGVESGKLAGALSEMARPHPPNPHEGSARGLPAGPARARGGMAS